MIRAGQRLREERLKKGFTLEDISKATKIRTSFLLSIENGEYQNLPASTYVLGFVRNYAKYLGLPEKETMALVRREIREEKDVKVLPEGMAKEDFPIRRIRLQQAVKIAIFTLLVLFGYILFQYRYAIISPPLKIAFPQEGEVVSSQTITVVGKTDPNATVFVNNEAAALDSNGNFKKTISAFVGKTTITVKAVNSFGKTTVVVRHIVIGTKQ